MLAKFRDLGRDDDRAIRLGGIAREIFLMVALSLEERRLVGDLRDDRVLPQLRRRQFGAHRFRSRALLGRLAEDHGAVLGPDIVALAVLRRRIVNREKHGEEIAKRQYRRVESHADDFGVTRPSAADVVVRRIRVAAAGVTRFDRFHPGKLVENRLEAPEAPAAEDGRFLRA